MNNDVLLGILILLFLGWFSLSRRSASSTSHTPSGPISPEYLAGLNYIINEEPDKALEQFIKLLKVDSDTAETHLALGSLFRRRGEVTRAIHIHQNLIARPHLSAEIRNQALLALGKDYFQAGVYDRAEALFSQVMKNDPHSTASIRLLLNIYQHEQEWEKAINLAQRLQNRSEVAMNREIAHFHCEIAKNCWERSERERCYWHLRQATHTDPHCVRASLMQGDIAIQTGHYKAAIKSLQQVEHQEQKFTILALPHLIEAHDKLHTRAQLLQYLKGLYSRNPSNAMLRYLVQEIHCNEGALPAIAFIQEALHTHPSIQGLHTWLLLKKIVEPQTDEMYVFIQDTLEKLTKSELLYQCEYCGISSKTLQWYCRGCSHWNSITPQLS